METRGYKARIVDDEIRHALTGAGAVVVEGSKACGKTTTAQSIAKSEIRLDDDLSFTAQDTSDPYILLNGETPRLIDEWQLIPKVWNAVRREVDDRRDPGQFILTGSATPADDMTRHSGAGRFLRITMRPMSLFESGESTGDVSLEDLWNGLKPGPTLQRPSLEAVAQAAVRGGWPGNLRLPLDIVQELNRGYLRSIASADIVTIDGKKRDPGKVGALLNALARNTATYVTNNKLNTDSAHFGEQIDPKTIASYLDALERLWVLVPQRAWGGHLRSSAIARKASKRHMVDPSLAAAAMNASVTDLMADHEAFGQVFETLVFRDLSVYAQPSGIDVRAFQDAKGNEIDAVLVKGTQWAGVEVKLAAIPTVIDAAATKLRAIAEKMTSKPRFLAVITADGPTTVRPDGVITTSIAALKP